MKTLFAISFFWIVLGACQSPAVYEEFYSIRDEEWDRYDVAGFEANIPDSGLYTVTLSLRHTGDYEMANLWCFVHTFGPAASDLRDTVNFTVAESDGRWIGEGGSFKTVKCRLKKNPVRLPKGKVSFRVEQGMRSERLKGVKDIGIRITRNGAE